MKSLLFTVITGCLLSWANPGVAADAAPRNVILIIGDGMDDQQITIARNYLHGAQGKLLMDSLPVRSSAQVLTVADSVSKQVVYVADSANTATSIATGTVTSRGRIATSAGDDRDLATIAELAQAAGLGTGVVTTSSVTDATPAAFATHVKLRICENPERMENIEYRNIPLGNCREDLRSAGGPGSIAEQLARSDLDVLLGGGAQHFEPAAEAANKSLLQLAQLKGFTLLRSKEELREAGTGQRLLGLFAPGHLPVRLRGESGRGAEKPSPSLLNRLHSYLGEVELPPLMRCEPNPEATTVPSLREMTEAALATLAADPSRGFFLMVESASIDKQAHKRQPCGSIGELEQLEEALASALEFAADHPQTLILVTADHSQAAQLVPKSSLFDQYGVPVYTPGKLALLRTPEDAVMGVNYATNDFGYEEHTGANVPLWGNEEARGRVPTYLRQPELFTIMSDYLGL